MRRRDALGSLFAICCNSFAIWILLEARQFACLSLISINVVSITSFLITAGHFLFCCQPLRFILSFGGTVCLVAARRQLTLLDFLLDVREVRLSSSEDAVGMPASVVAVAFAMSASIFTRHKQSSVMPVSIREGLEVLQQYADVSSVPFLQLLLPVALKLSCLRRKRVSMDTCYKHSRHHETHPYSVASLLYYLCRLH